MDPITRLNATVTGHGPRTLVLANGFCTASSSWDAVAANITGAGWRLVRFDYAGTPRAPRDGWSSARHGTLYGHADDVVQMLDALDVRHAVFLGHSMSAMVGALVRLSAPTMVDRLVMIGASPRYIDEADYVGGFSRDDVDALLQVAEQDLARWIAGFAPLALGEGAAPTHLADYAEHLVAMRPDIAMMMLRGIFLSDFRDILSRVDCPVDLLQTSDDVAVPRVVAEYLARALPQARLHMLDCQGHLPHLTHPALVLPIVTQVLREAA